MKLKPRTRLWIQDGEGKIVFGSGRMRILDAIDSTGSMNKAARELGMSYRTIWGRIHDTEKRLGFKLIKTRAGGSAEGGSTLTPKSREILSQFRKWQDGTLEFADKLFAKLFEKKSGGKSGK